MMEPKWLEWSKRLNAIAQNGLTFTKDPFDIERYHAIRALAAEMIAAGTDETIEKVQNLLSSDAGYATPKVDVRGVVFRDDKILLVQERSDNLWTLPGGWADIGESPSQAVVKEVREEAGLHVRVSRLLAVLDRNKHNHPPHPNHIYKLFILCEITGGELTSSMETQGAEFFKENELPPLSLTRVMPEQIKRMFEHYRDSELETDFD